MQRVCRQKTLSRNILAILRVLNKRSVVHFAPPNPTDRTEDIRAEPVANVELAFFKSNVDGKNVGVDI